MRSSRPTWLVRGTAACCRRHWCGDCSLDASGYFRARFCPMPTNSSLARCGQPANAIGGGRLPDSGRGDDGSLRLGPLDAPGRGFGAEDLCGHGQRPHRSRAHASRLGTAFLRRGDAHGLPVGLRLGAAVDGRDRLGLRLAGPLGRGPHGRGRAAEPAGRRRYRRRGRRGAVPAADPDPLYLHRPAGRLRLHGPGRLLDGPRDGPRRA